MPDFEETCVSTNNKKGAPHYDESFMDGLRKELVDTAPDELRSNFCGSAGSLVLRM